MTEGSVVSRKKFVMKGTLYSGEGDYDGEAYLFALSMCRVNRPIILNASWSFEYNSTTHYFSEFS